MVTDGYMCRKFTCSGVGPSNENTIKFDKCATRWQYKNTFYC